MCVDCCLPARGTIHLMFLERLAFAADTVVEPVFVADILRHFAKENQPSSLLKVVWLCFYQGSSLTWPSIIQYLIKIVLNIILYSYCQHWYLMQPLPDPEYNEYSETQQKRLRLRESMQNAIKGYATIDDILCQKISKVNAINKFTSKLKIENRNMEQLMVEMQTLNISKFLDEVVNIIVQTVTINEVRSLAELACRIGIYYETFPKTLIKQLKKRIDHCLTLEERSQLVPLFYMLIELFVYGFPLVQNDIPELIKKVFKSGLSAKQGITMDQSKKQRNYAFNIDFYCILVKEFGDVFCGLSSRRVQRWAKEGRELFKFPEMVTVQIKKSIFTFLEKYIKDVATVLEQSFKTIEKTQSTLRTELKLDGSFKPQTEKSYKEMVQRYTKTKQKLIEIGQYISYQITFTGMNQKILDIQEISKLQFAIVQSGQIFEDEYQKDLYLNLMEIDQQNVKAEDPQKYSEFKTKLQNCKNIQDADNLIKLFLPINTKKTRKMLVKDLLDYRRQYQLVTPFLCRIAATLNKKWKDIEETVNQMIMNEYEKLKQFSNNSFIMNDKRTRNYKYICELTKFGLIDCNKTIACIKVLVDDLIGINIDLLLLCLESVGRLLYLTKESTSKFVFLLNQLNNVMKKKPLPVMIQSQINNCISLLKPIEPIQKKEKPPKSQAEIELKRLLKEINKDNIEETVDSVSKMISNNPQNQQLFIKRLIKSIPKHQFIESYYLAVLLDKLDNDELFFKVKTIVKSTIIDLINKQQSQQSVAWARFYGEMFNYQILTRDEFYSFLRELLSLKQNDIGIINAICTILGTCIDSLVAKKTATINQKLRFLLEFKVFINTRKYIPMFTEFDILDLLQEIQPEIVQIPMDQILSFQVAMSQKQLNRQKELNQLKELENISMYKKKPVYKERTEQEEYNRQQEPQLKKQTSQSARSTVNIDDQFNNYLKDEVQKSMGRMAKPKIAEEAGIKKKKVGEKSVMILGKSGNKIVRKEVNLKE